MANLTLNPMVLWGQSTTRLLELQCLESKQSLRWLCRAGLSWVLGARGVSVGSIAAVLPKDRSVSSLGKADLCASLRVGCPIPNARLHPDEFHGRLVSGWCPYGVWMTSRWYPGGVQVVSGWCCEFQKRVCCWRWAGSLSWQSGAHVTPLIPVSAARKVRIRKSERKKKQKPVEPKVLNTMLCKAGREQVRVLGVPQAGLFGSGFSTAAAIAVGSEAARNQNMTEGQSLGQFSMEGKRAAWLTLASVFISFKSKSKGTLRLQRDWEQKAERTRFCRKRRRFAVGTSWGSAVGRGG